MIQVSWSDFAPVETTLELLASSLRDVKLRISPLFAQSRTAKNAGLFLDGLLGGEPRKRGRCVRKRRVILVRGGSRRFWAATAGRRMICAIWCAIM